MAKIIQIRDVPDDVHDTLLGEAKAAGLSLNQFILREYQFIAGRAKNAEIFARAAGRGGQRLRRDDIVTTLRQLREDGK